MLCARAARRAARRARQVSSTSSSKLAQPLLAFRGDASPELPLLAVNFDPALVALLRETRGFLGLGIEARLLAVLRAQSPDACAASGVRHTAPRCPCAMVLRALPVLAGPRGRR